MPPLFRKMETRRLHGTDIKQLMHILRNDPHTAADPEDIQHEKAAQVAIKNLPRRLRATLLSSHGLLCRTHKGLDAHLIDNIWAWIKFELEVAVGRFLYPIIMSDVLSGTDELRVRQLEPVVEMFLLEWTLAESTPPGKLPVDTGTKWAYQKNGCPACMLTRIGSDEGALFALLAGMYGHLRPRSGNQNCVDKIKSKRLRFVRYWMCTHANGDQTAQEAYDLGMELKTLRHDAKVSLRSSGQPTEYARDSLDESPTTARHCLDDQPEVSVDISAACNPKDRVIISRDYDSDIGPVSPREATTSTIIKGLNQKHSSVTPQASFRIQSPTQRSATSAASFHSIHTTHMTSAAEDDTLASLPMLSHACLNSGDSVLSPSSATIRFYPTPSLYSSPSQLTSIASFNTPNEPSRHRCRHDPMETGEERLNKYRKMMARKPYGWQADEGEGVEFQGRLLPRPSWRSIYSVFGDDECEGRSLRL